MTGEQMLRRQEWAKSLTELCNNFPSAKTEGDENDRHVTLALAVLVAAATRAGL